MLYTEDFNCNAHEVELYDTSMSPCAMQQKLIDIVYFSINRVNLKFNNIKGNGDV